MSDRDPHLSPTEKPSGGGISEDWLATVVGLLLLVIALAGLVPGWALW